MSDRIVYVHAEHTSDTTTIITPKDFDTLLEDGEWDIKERTKKKIDGKTVDMYHLYKPSKERGVALVGPSERGERNTLMEHQHRGSNDARGVAIVPSNNSFLGTSDFNGLPGLKVANSLVINHAYGMGADGASRGEPISACPWPEGVGRTQWLKGWHAAAKQNKAIDPKAISEAYEAGKVAAQGPDDLEVHCPYPTGTGQYKEWVRGFAENGGKIL